MSTKIVFDNGGNFTRKQATRVRVQSDAGVKQWGLLTFPFQSSTQTVEINYVRVRKADGSTIITPPENVQDLDAEITRSAPFYSDLREKHVAVKGLSGGDILEYEAHWQTTKPLIPGQFWFQYNFNRDAIVLGEQLEIKVPAERVVNVRGPQASQTVSSEPGSRVYTWTHSKLRPDKEPEDEPKKAVDAALGRLAPPDVQISSFQSWEEVGRWYWNLQKDRMEPTPAIRAKAMELTKGLTDDDAKVRALYSFVSTQYRYIGIAFGIGRYQPHTAEDVLSNKYGDCKDKHTLLASLLLASGLKIYPALISSNWKIDPDFPSPAEFDHIIGYLPPGKDNKAVWLDTTPEIAPFGYLIARLRDKQALVISEGKSAQLHSTPFDPPFPTTEVFKINGTLDNDGTFDANVEHTARGDSEVVMRAAFRQVPQPRWKDLVQQVSYALGFAGTVSDVSAGVPEAISDPFHFSYSYNRKEYPTWKSDKQFTVPGLPFFMPQVKDDTKGPIWLGPPSEMVSDSKVQVPAGYTPEVPSNLDLTYDFAEYHASYSYASDSVDRRVLVAKRRLLIKLHEVPVAELQTYKNFVESLHNDRNQYVRTSSSFNALGGVSPNTYNSGPTKSIPKPVQDILEMPPSNSDDANRLEAEARDKMAKQDFPGAVSSFYRAVAADAKFARAWVFLGQALLIQHQTAAAVDAFKKAIAIDPDRSAIQKTLGWGLMASLQYDDAVPIWQEYTAAHPSDVDGPSNLASCLLKLHRYSEATSALEAALKIKGDYASLQSKLASAYVLAGEPERAGAAFAKLGDMTKESFTLNDAAYQMANADLKLPLALVYAEKASRSAEEESQKITLQSLTVEDLGKIFKIAAFWDTLGWVHERMSHFEVAERYLQASWRLTQDGVTAGHLCHMYKRMHRTANAVQMCRAAILRMSMSKELADEENATEMAAAQENLRHLTGARELNGKQDGSDLVVRELMFKLPRFLPGTESAEFFVLLAADAKSNKFKVEDVKFISGAPKMKTQGKQLKTIDFNVPAPSDVPTRFVRRGILGCYQYTGCSFVLLDPAVVHTLD